MFQLIGTFLSGAFRHFLPRRSQVGRVLVLVNGQVVRAVRPWLHRMDVANVHGPTHLVSGFRIDFRVTQSNSTQPRQIVVLAVDARSELSTELSWSEESSLLTHRISATKDEKIITAIGTERARGWCLQTTLEQRGPSAPKRKPQRLALNRWFLRWRARPELNGRIHQVERVDNLVVLRGSVFDVSGQRAARWVEIYTGARLLGRTSVGIWQGDTFLAGRGYGAFTALIPAEWIEVPPMANLRVRAVSTTGQFGWLPWSGEDVLARHQSEPSFHAAETTCPMEVNR